LPGDSKALALHANILQHQADALYQSNALADAERTYRLELGDWSRLAASGDPNVALGTAFTEEGLGNVMFWTNKLGSALSYYTQAQTMVEQAGPGKDPREFEIFIAQIEQERGYTESWLNHSQQAGVLLQQSISRAQKWTQAHPDDLPAMRLLAASWMDLGDNMAQTAADKQPMLDAYIRYRTTLAQVAARDPADVRARRLLALGEQKVADAYFDMKRYDLALAGYLKARDAEQAIADHDASDQTTRGDLAQTLSSIGGTLKAQGDRAGAEAAYRRSLALRQAFVDQDPHAAMERRDLALTQGNLAGVLTDRRDACSHLLASEGLWQQLVSEGSAPPSDLPKIERVRRQAAGCH
jgi:tetratricopeptide (TPR) repeat protein